jgi:hypothetical protein
MDVAKLDVAKLDVAKLVVNAMPVAVAPSVPSVPSVPPLRKNVTHASATVVLPRGSNEPVVRPAEVPVDDFYSTAALIDSVTLVDFVSLVDALTATRFVKLLQVATAERSALASMDRFLHVPRIP